MPYMRSTPFGNRWENDAMDTSDRFNADRQSRLSEMALGMLGQQANYKLGMAGLQNSRDMAQAGINMNAMGLQSQERMHGADLGFAGKGLQAQSDALRQQMDLERGRDTTQQTNYQQMLEMGKPMREISLEEMKSKAALEQLQMAQLKAQTEAQTKAQAGTVMPTNLSDFERGDLTNDIAAGLTPAAAAQDIQGKRRTKAGTEATALAGSLSTRTKSLADRDRNWFFDKPTDTESWGINQGFEELVKKYQDSGMDETAARAKAKDIVMQNAPDPTRRPHVAALYQALGLR